MKSRNIYNKMFIILAAIIIPLMITIGLAAWIMISEERIKPKYNPDSAFYVYLNKQETTYTGSPQLPSNPNITIDSSVTYKYRKVGETNYTNGAPTNAGEYYINFSSSKDKTEGGYPSSDVYFKINKATPTVSSWPTLNAMYWGNTLSFNTTGDTTNGSFSIVDGSFAFKSGGSRASAELPYTVSLLYTPKDTENYNTLTQTANVTLKAVANVSTTFYATVDEAITSTTSGTIYVMLTEAGSDKAKTIGATTTETTVTLASGVTLYVPYYMDTSTSPYTYNVSLQNTIDDSGNLREFGELNHGYINYFADNTYLKNYIIIDSDTTLDVVSEATLQVTGIIGSATAGLAGHTSGAYAEIKMLKGSSIIIDGLLICGGYIKEVDSSLNYVNNKNWDESVYSAPSENAEDAIYFSTVTISSTGELRMPFVIHDYRGGSSTAATYIGNKKYGITELQKLTSVEGNIFPFSRFDLPNIQTKVVFEHGSLLLGYANLYTGAVGSLVKAQHNVTTVALIGQSGDSAFIEMSDGTTIVSECVTKTAGTTTKDYDSRKTTLTIDGSIKLNYVSMSLKVAIIDVSLTSADVLFPICDLFDIIFNSGTSNIDVNLKIMPGCNIVVRNNATLNVGVNRAAELILFSDFNDIVPIEPQYPKSSDLGQKGAGLYVDGVLNIGANASFGGNIYSFGENGEINIDSNATLNVKSVEGYGGFAHENYTTFIFSFYQTDLISEMPKAYIYKNGPIDTKLTTLLAGTYRSKKGTDKNYGWYASSANIYYDTMGGQLEGDSFSGPYTTGTLGYKISLDSINTSKPTRDHYTFAGWYLSPEYNSSEEIFRYDSATNELKLINNYILFVNTTLYAKWIPIEYTITYGNSYTFTGGSGSFSTNTNLTSFTYETANELLTKPVHANGYVFEGWYYTSDNTKLTMLNGSELVNYLSSNNVNIYAKWYPAGTETFTVNYVNERNDEIPCLESQDLIIETEDSWSNYSLPNIGYNNNITTYQYYFAGWYTSDTTLVTSLSEELFSSSTTITLYAKWEVKYRVLLDWNDYGTDQVLYIIPNSTFTFPTYSLDQKEQFVKSTTYITEYTPKWNGLYNCGSESPKITDDITFVLSKVEVGKYYNVNIVCNNTSVTITTDGVYILYVNDNGDYTKGNSFDFYDPTKEQDKNKAGAETTLIYIKLEAVVSCSFTYPYAEYNGYKIYNTNKSIQEDTYSTGGWWPSYAGKPANPSNFTIEAYVHNIESASGIADSSACIFSDAQILMADGTTKQVTEIKVGDLVTTWSFEEGKFVVRPVIFFEALESVMVNKITLYFDDNTQVEIAYAQSFFDIDKLEYFSINADNVHEYVGVNIMTHNNGNVSSKQIVDYKLEIVMEDVYEIITGYDYSFIYDNILTMEPFMLYKLPFEITSELKYDEELMKEDIEKYGLYTYDEWYMHGTEQMFDLMNVKYFKVAIEKGYYTLEYLLELYEYYFVSDNIS